MEQHRNIEAADDITLSNLEDVKELVESIKDLIKKEEVVDDLETIKQEINSKNTKYIKIRKIGKELKILL